MNTNNIYDVWAKAAEAVEIGVGGRGMVVEKVSGRGWAARRGRALRWYVFFTRVCCACMVTRDGDIEEKGRGKKGEERGRGWVGGVGEGWI